MTVLCKHKQLNQPCPARRRRGAGRQPGRGRLPPPWREQPREEWKGRPSSGRYYDRPEGSLEWIQNQKRATEYMFVRTIAEVRQAKAKIKDLQDAGHGPPDMTSTMIEAIQHLQERQTNLNKQWERAKFCDEHGIWMWDNDESSKNRGRRDVVLWPDAREWARRRAKAFSAKRLQLMALAESGPIRNRINGFRLVKDPGFSATQSLQDVAHLLTPALYQDATHFVDAQSVATLSHTNKSICEAVRGFLLSYKQRVLTAFEAGAGPECQVHVWRTESLKKVHVVEIAGCSCECGNNLVLSTNKTKAIPAPAPHLPLPSLAH